MNDPDRLTDTSSEDPGVALLRAAKGYRASAQTRQRALAAVGLTGSAGVTKPLGKGALSSAKVALWGFSGVLVLAGGYALVSRTREPVRPAAVAPPALVSVAPLPQAAAPPAPSVAAPVNAIVHESSPGATSPPSSASSAPLNAAQASTARLSSDLAGELAALDGAAKAIQAGNGAGALNLLDGYAHAFPHGSLDLEAKVLRAEALESAGRHGEAVARAKAFVAHYPKSPLALRMRRLAGD